MIRTIIATCLISSLCSANATALEKVVEDFLDLTNIAGIDVTQATVQDVVWALGSAKLYKMNPTTEDEWIAKYDGESKGLYLCYRLRTPPNEEGWTLIFNFDLSLRVRVLTYALLNRKLEGVDCTILDKSNTALYRQRPGTRTSFPNRTSLLTTFSAVTNQTNLKAFFTTRAYEKTTDLTAVNRELKTLNFAVEDASTMIYVGVSGRFTDSGKLSQLIVGGSRAASNANQSRRP